MVKLIGRFQADFSQAIEQGQRYGAELQKLDNLLKQIASNAGVQIQSQATQIRTATDKVAEGVKKVDKAIDAKGAGKEGFWERRFGWFVAGSAFYGSLQAARDIVDNLKQIEFAMTTIKRISDEPLADFAQMQKELLNLGVEYGQTWSVISDIATKWAQAGYSINDTLELTRTSLLALNTAELNSTQATTGLISVMSQWQLSADELLPALDMINKTADSFAVNSQDLIDGMARSSGAARMLGLSLEETIALLTTMREATGRTGREIGNALNSILAFIQRPTSLNAFKAAGIEVWADATHSKLRSVVDIFQDAAKSWGTLAPQLQDQFIQAADAAGLYTEEVQDIVSWEGKLTQEQQRSLSQAAAGTYRRNYFLALMQNWANIDEVLVNLEGSLGYSMRENERTMETYQKKIYQMQAAWESFSQTFAEAGFLDQLKAFAEVGTGTLQVFNALPAPVKAATGALVEFAAAIAMIRLAEKTFRLGGFFENMMSVGLKMGSKGVAELGLWGATTPFWQVALPAAGMIGIISLIRQQIKYNEALEEGAAYYRESAEAGKDMSQVMNDLGRKFPELILEIDKEGNVIKLATDRLEAHDQKLQDTKKSVEDLTDEYHKLTQEMIDLTGQINRVAQSEAPPFWAQVAAMPSTGMFVTSGVTHGYTRDNYMGGLMDELGKRRARLDALSGELKSRGVTAPGMTTEPFTIPDLGVVKDRYDQVTGSALSLDLALIEVRKSLRLVESEEKSLGETMEDANRKKVLAAQRARLLAEENDLLGASNSDLNARLTVLNELMGQADEAISSLAEGTEKDNWLSFQKSITSEIRSTTQELADNTVEMRDNQLAIQNSSREVQEFYDRIREAQRTLKDESFQMIRDSIDHQVRMGAMNRDHQISYLRQMLIAYADDAERRREIEEDLQDLYREGIEEQLDIAEEAYRKRRQMIEDEADAEIASIQRRIDALNDKSELASREEAERQHKNKLQELEKEWQYHDLRLGKDHEKSKLDITQQIEEEKIRWKNQVDEWSRDDRRKRLEEEIDDIREAARKAQDELDDAWKRTQTMFDQNVATMIASASVFNDSWYYTGLSWGERLAEGLMAGSKSIDRVLSDISGEARSAGSDSGKMARSLELLEAKREWERANELGDVEGMKRAAEWGKRIRSSGATIDPSNTLSSDELAKLIKSQLPQAHTGAYVAESGIANLLKGEIVLNPRLSTQFARLADALERNPSMSTSTNFNIKSLVNLENADLSDKQDLDALASILFGRMVSLMNSKGSTLGVSA